MSEIPVHSRPRRLADWINPTGAKKVHSLIDKVYKRKNLEMAWEKVKANRGSGGVDGQNLEAFAGQLDPQLDRLHSELKEDTYQPQPVRQVQIPKAGKPGEFRMLGVPTIYDRVCQQALLNRLEPIFELVFDEANFGYRRGRSTKDAMRKVWKEIQSGREWIVDADLKDFFGSVDHERLLTLVAQRIADRRVLRLIRAMLKAGSYGKGRLFPSERGTPQGSVITPLRQKVIFSSNT
jgi:group II intron reverse transcriptase/maturase